MMDVLAGVLTGSHFGSNVAGPYEKSRRSGCGHMLLTINVAAMMPREEFDARMETLISEVKSNPMAEGVSEIFFPGELEDHNTARHNISGIAIADQTWQSMAKLASETQVALPPV
jgi:LDH2 family malate/lactate/ureidoglycolate dehydrogenase